MLTGSGGYLWGLILLIMIKTNGLQRDNYIQCLFVIGKVLEIYSTKALCQLPSGKIEVYDAEHLNYIPLTPEWLERCGFAIPIDDGFFVRVVSGVVAIKLTDIGLPVVRVGDMHFTNTLHLHQLQNLYQALTGEELQIKLP